MKIANYLETKNIHNTGKELNIQLRFTRFPYELFIPQLLKIVGFRFWFYPLAIKTLFEIKNGYDWGKDVSIN